MHFEQVYPLPLGLEERLAKAEKIVVIENNATGQFANLLQMTYGIKLPKRILKYNGEPFFIDELEVKFTEVSHG